MDLFITFAISLAFTMFFYLLVPIIIIMRGKQYPIKTLKRIAIINGIVVWFLFQLVATASGGEASNGSAAFLWSYVGYWFMKKKCLSESKSTADFETVRNNPSRPSDNTCQKTHFEIASSQEKRICRRCGSSLGTNDEYCSLCGERYVKKTCVIKSFVAICVLSFLVVGLFVLNVVQYNSNLLLQDKVSSLTEELKRIKEYTPNYYINEDGEVIEIH